MHFLLMLKFSMVARSASCYGFTLLKSVLKYMNTNGRCFADVGDFFTHMVLRLYACFIMLLS